VTKGVEMEKNQACIGYNFLVEKEKASWTTTAKRYLEPAFWEHGWEFRFYNNHWKTTESFE
jgi:hypothetical protein